MYSIYKHTLPNGKVYIGQTTLEVENRWKNGRGYFNNKNFYNDILDCGWSNVKHEILETTDDKEEATKLERKYILQYKSYLSEYGYNKNTNASSKERRGYNLTKIICVDTGVIYDNMARAAEAVGRSSEAIRYAIKNNTKCAGCTWLRN